MRIQYNCAAIRSETRGKVETRGETEEEAEARIRAAEMQVPADLLRAFLKLTRPSNISDDLTAHTFFDSMTNRLRLIKQTFIAEQRDRERNRDTLRELSLN